MSEVGAFIVIAAAKSKRSEFVPINQCVRRALFPRRVRHSNDSLVEMETGRLSIRRGEYISRPVAAKPALFARVAAESGETRREASHNADCEIEWTYAPPNGFSRTSANVRFSAYGVTPIPSKMMVRSCATSLQSLRTMFSSFLIARAGILRSFRKSNSDCSRVRSVFANRKADFP